MGRTPEPSSLKRKRPPEGKSAAHNLSDAERKLYHLIQSKEDMGIWTSDMKRETNLPDTIFNKSLKSLQAKTLIKPVVNIKNKTRKYFMAVEFEPSNELTGGSWYVDGDLDLELIQKLKELCRKFISNRKVATIEQVSTAMIKSGAFNVGTKDIADILRSMVLDDEIMEVTSTGIGEFLNIRSGTVCYKCINKSGVPKVGALASIPCGVCPRINECTPDGIISPITCVYYKKWLDF